MRPPAAAVRIGFECELVIRGRFHLQIHGVTRRVSGFPARDHADPVCRDLADPEVRKDPTPNVDPVEQFAQSRNERFGPVDTADRDHQTLPVRVILI